MHARAGDDRSDGVGVMAIPASLPATAQRPPAPRATPFSWPPVVLVVAALLAVVIDGISPFVLIFVAALVAILTAWRLDDDAKRRNE